jgi:serine/threonine-protein kinase
LGFWSFLKKSTFPPAPEPDEERERESQAAAAYAERRSASPRAPEERSEIALLRRVGASSSPSPEGAIAALQSLRASPDEARAVEVLLDRAAERPLPEALAIALASTLTDRGEARAAIGLLAHASSSPALLMSADLRAESGDVAGAMALTERVLLRDLDHPGARERHRRWRAALGIEAAPTRADASGATVVTREADAPFVLLREVARGGAGAVYEAEDRDLGRRVALKVYHHPDRDRAQLTHEARVAAEVAGAGVLRVFDIDPDHGWIALEWAALGALRDHIRAVDRATLLPLERWVVPLASALARIHAAGWIHHDVKPANVLLHAPDRPVLADFGTARRPGDPPPAGSLGYVSPERIAGRPSDVRDDIFGFGRILEDALDALGDPDLDARWRPIAIACVGPDDGRPADARALLTRLRVEAQPKRP